MRHTLAQGGEAGQELGLAGLGGLGAGPEAVRGLGEHGGRPGRAGGHGAAARAGPGRPLCGPSARQAQTPSPILLSLQCEEGSAEGSSEVLLFLVVLLHLHSFSSPPLSGESEGLCGGCTPNPAALAPVL